MASRAVSFYHPCHTRELVEHEKDRMEERLLVEETRWCQFQCKNITKKGRSAKQKQSQSYCKHGGHCPGNSKCSVDQLLSQVIVRVEIPEFDARTLS
jgi:hypothetical protein